MCHLSLREIAAKTSPSGGSGAKHQKGCISLAPQARLACFPFARKGGCMVLYILAAQPPTTTLTAEGRVKLQNPLNLLNPHAEGVSKKQRRGRCFFSVFQCSNDFINVFYVILIAPFIHFVHDAFHGCGVSQVGGAYLDGIRAGYHEFDGVFAGHNAA